MIKLFLLFLLTSTSIFATIQKEVKHILLLHSYNQSMSWVQNINDAVYDTLRPDDNGYLIHIENMDTKRMYTKEYLEELKSIYAIKYKNLKFDLILSTDNNAFDFLKKNRDELFGNIPISFSGVNFFKDSNLDGFDNVTGVAEIFDAKSTIESALKLYPNAKSVYIINDYLKSGLAWSRTIKEQLKDFDKSIKITYSENLPIKELQNKISKLPKNSIVLLGVYFKDRDGDYFTYEKIGQAIVSKSKPPVFCLLEFNLNNGVVGGNVIGGYYQGKAMSRIAKRILNGENASKIDVLKTGATKYIFDYNGMKRFDMRISEIPKNSIILNKPVPFYEKHKNVLLLTLFLILVLLLVIVLLLINNKKIRKAKEELQKVKNDLEVQYQNLYNHSLEMRLSVDAKTAKIINCNETLADRLGITKEEIIGKEIFELYHPDSIDEVNKVLESFLKTGSITNKELVLKKADGSTMNILLNSSAVYDKDGNILYSESSWTDISEIKKSQNLLKATNDKLLGLYNLSPLGIALTDVNGRYVEFNSAFANICGYEFNELNKLDYWELTPDKYKDDEMEQLKSLKSTGFYGPYEKEYYKKDGTLIPINLNGMTITEADGKEYTWSIVEDISDRKYYERMNELRSSLAELAYLGDIDKLLQFALNTAELMTNGKIGFFHLLEKDQENISLYVYSTNTLEKMSATENVNTAYPISSEVWVDCIHKREPVIQNNHESIEYKNELTLPIFKDNLIVGVIGVGNKEHEYDVNDVKILQHIADVAMDYMQKMKSEQKIEFMAYYDELTSLPNRSLLADRLSQAIAFHKRTKKNLAVCFMDLDGFKPVNDKYGHHIGDKLLISLSKRILAHLREEDTFARIGGDEFVLVITDLDEPDGYIEVLERIFNTVKTPFDIDGHRIHISSSIGVTIFPLDDSDADVLLRHADQAMYQAKESGKSSYKLYHSIEKEEIKKQNKLLEEFSLALSKDELILHYQPKIDLRSGRVIGAEALIRWRHPTRGFLFPEEFIPFLSNTPLEIKLDEWVVKKAFKQRSEFENAKLDLSISINISPRHIQLDGFVDFISNELSIYNENFAKYIELEILETSDIYNTQIVSENMIACSNLGIRFSLDDFGTGYSSIQHLHNFPINILKIDQKFVKDMFDDSNDLDIVEGILKLANALKKPAVAEGVETIEIGLMLLYLGCQYAQGYGIAKPMPIEKFSHWLNEWHENSIWFKIKKESLLDSKAYDINVAIFTHKKWLQDVIDYIESFPSSLEVPKSENTCQFGKWYNGVGRNRYGDRESYAFLQARHNKVHQFASELVEMTQLGEKKKAMSKVEELKSLADYLIYLLKELSNPV